MLKISLAHFVTTFEMGGVRSIVEDLASGLPKDKFKVYVCSLWGENYKNPKNDNGIFQYVCFQLNGFNKHYAIFKIINFLRENKIQIVHTHPGTLSRLATIIARVPVIVSTWHGSYSYSIGRRFLARYLARHTSMFVANSSFTRGYNTAALSLPEGRSVTIYNGIDLQRFGFRDEAQGRRMRQSLGIPMEAKVVSTAGRLHPDKGIEVLVMAAVEIIRTASETYFIVAGDGENRERLEARVRDLGISRQVRFTGSLADVRPVLWASDLFVLPSSKREGFGLALVEAMATGLPVVGTNLGGIPEIVKPGVNGLLAAPGCKVSLAAQIQKLLSDDELAAKLAHVGQQTVREIFDVRSMVNQYISLYMDLLQKGQRQ